MKNAGIFFIFWTSKNSFLFFLFKIVLEIFIDVKNTSIILKGQKKNQTGKVYYFQEGEHHVKFISDKMLLTRYYNGQKQAWSSIMCKILLRQCDLNKLWCFVNQFIIYKIDKCN